MGFKYAGLETVAQVATTWSKDAQAYYDADLKDKEDSRRLGRCGSGDAMCLTKDIPEGTMHEVAMQAMQESTAAVSVVDLLATRVRGRGGGCGGARKRRRVEAAYGVRVMALAAGLASSSMR